MNAYSVDEMESVAETPSGEVVTETSCVIEGLEIEQ